MPWNAAIPTYQKALQKIHPQKVILASTEISDTDSRIYQAEILLGSVQRSLNWLLKRVINPARVIVIAPEQCIRAYQRFQRSAVPLYEAFFLRLALMLKSGRQLFIFSAEPGIIFHCLDRQLISRYFEHADASGDYDFEFNPHRLSTDELDLLLLVLLWRRHLSLSRICILLERGPQRTGLLLCQIPSRARILQRLASLQNDYEEQLIAKASFPGAKWTTTARGRALLCWGFEGTKEQAIEAILQDKGSSEKKVWRLLTTFIGQEKDQQLLQSLLEWLKRDEKASSEPILSKEMVFQVGFRIKHLHRFHSKRLSFEDQQTLQRLLEYISSKKVELSEDNSEENPDTANEKSLNDKVKEPSIFHNILSYLGRLNMPVTAQTVAHGLSLPIWKARYLLEKLVKSGVHSLEKRTLIDGTTKRAYYALKFPLSFAQTCGQCHWFAANHCAMWNTVVELAPHKAPANLKNRAWGLQPGSVACSAYQSTVATRSTPFESFTAQQTRTVDIDEEGRLITGLACCICETLLPALHGGTEVCPNCATVYRISRTKNGDLIVAFSPDFDHLLTEIIQQYTGFAAFHRKIRPQKRRGISILADDAVSIDDENLVLTRLSGRWSSKLSQLDYVRLHHCELPATITRALEQYNVKIHSVNGSSSQSLIAPPLIKAIAFARLTGAFNRILVKSNLMSRLILWERHFSKRGQSYRRFMNALVRIFSTNNGSLLTSYEGQAAEAMWAEVHSLVCRYGFSGRSRVKERRIQDRLDRVGLRTAAHSALHAVINSLFLAGYESCRHLHDGAGLGYHGTGGVLHYRRSKSYLDSVGIHLDLSDIIKPLLLSDLLELIKNRQLSSRTISFFHGRRGVKIFSLSSREHHELQTCVDTALTSPVVMGSQLVPLRVRYSNFIENFCKALVKVYEAAMKEFHPFHGIEVSGVWVASMREARPELADDPHLVADPIVSEFQELWQRVQRKAIRLAEEYLSPLLLARGVEEYERIQEIWEVLETWL